LKPFDIHGEFAPTVPGGGHALRRLAIRSAGVTILSGVGRLAIQMVGTVVLARLIAPRDFGLVTMVTTFSVLLMSCGSNGITEAILQCDQITHRLASNLFWATMGVGVCLTLGFAAVGPVLAKIYREPSLIPLCAALSVPILLSSGYVVHLSLLRRAMRFSAVAKIELASRAVSVTTGILFAFAGFGRWALVLGWCALPLTTMVGGMVMCHWVPGRPRRAAGTDTLIRFAAHTFARFSMQYFAANTDNLLVGWLFGAPALGFYKRAYDLFALSAAQLVNATATVAVSALSRVRNERESYRSYLLGAITVMAFLGMGIGGDLTLVGKDLIRVLLGPGWETTGEIFTYFAPGIGAMLVYGTHGWIHLSIGRADRWFVWGMVEWLTITSLFLVGLHWGPQGIAVAWAVSFWILAVPSLWFAGRPIGLGVGPMLSAVWPFILASLVAGGTTRILLVQWVSLSRVAGAGGAALRLVLVSVTFGALYLGGIVALHGGFTPVRRLVGLFKEMASVAKRPASAAAVINEEELQRS
jgi:PST family polysaccharide transporter